MTFALMAALAMTFGLLFYIFVAPEGTAAPEKSRLAYLRERKEVVYENLRDLNFELKAGKVAEDDYQSLRNSLEQEATELLAEIERLESEQGVPA